MYRTNLRSPTEISEDEGGDGLGTWTPSECLGGLDPLPRYLVYPGTRGHNRVGYG